jgi:hypothetical protein
MRVLDLCAGRLGISRVFAARGHQVTAVDLVEPPDIPAGVTFIKADILTLTAEWVRDNFDFGWASTPCEEFSVHGMKHFHPNPKYPAMGLKLFNHAREILTEAGIPFVMENVRPAQKFVGNAVHHCGPFYLWGNSVPMLMPQGIKKGMTTASCDMTKLTKEERKTERKRHAWPPSGYAENGELLKRMTAEKATVPSELSTTIADYAERILEVPA